MATENDTIVNRRKFLTLAGATAAGTAVAGQAAGEGLPPWVLQQEGERTAVDVIGVSDGDTVDIRYDDGTEETIRVLGVDTPEKEQFARFERPEEWEGLAYRPDISALERVTITSSCSLYAADGTPLTDEGSIALWAADSAETESTDDEPPVVEYGGDTPIPVVAVDGSVVGFGAMLVDDERPFEEDQEEFLVNVWNHYVGSGTVLWDEGHDQFYTLENFQSFRAYAARNNYTLEGTTDLTARVDEADAVVVTSPSSSFSTAELDALADFVADGGALFLHDQSDFQGFDETTTMNSIARHLDLSFRFNDDQVVDTFRNEDNDQFRPWTERFNDADFPSFFRDRAGIDGGATTRTTPHLLDWAERATSFARERLAGERVEIAFDPEEPRVDANGRLLSYIYHDSTGDGSRDALYNRALVESGHARVYASGFSRFHEFRAAEETARESGTGIWDRSSIQTAPSYRNRPVEDLFFPEPVPVQSTAGQLPSERVPVHAPASADQDGESVSYDGDIPLVGVDPNARTAVVGAPLVDEGYEQTEGFAADTSIYENFVLVANLVTALTAEDGQILVDGGHNQFGVEYAACEEDAAYFQRYLEGQGIRFEQINDVTGEHLDGQALVVTTPPESYSPAELRAVQSFTEDGGAVVLMGSAAAPESALGHLNDIAVALQTDLRVATGGVTDSENSRADDPALVATSNRNEAFEGLFTSYDGLASVPETAQRDPAIETPDATVPTDDGAMEQAGEDGDTVADSGESDSMNQTERTVLLGLGTALAGAVISFLAWLGLWVRDRNGG